MRSQTAKSQKPPAFQLYVKDFLTDEKVQLLPLEAVGAYILLLCQAWLSDPPGTLPNDDTALAKFSRLGDRWPEHASQLQACFKLVNGRLVSEKLRSTYLELQEFHKERSESGKKGASRRWNQDGRAISSDKAEPLTNDSFASASSSASSINNPLSPTSGGDSAMQKRLGLRAEGKNPRAIAAKQVKARAEELQRRQQAALHDVPSDDELPTAEDIRRAKEDAGLMRRSGSQENQA